MSTHQHRNPLQDRFPYGWRDVPIQKPDGSWGCRQVPLTLADFLHPQMGDQIPQSSLHNLNRSYLAMVARAVLADDPGALVLSRTGIYWDDPRLRHHAPDLAVIHGVRERRHDWSGFHVAEQGVRPRLLIEVVEPATRHADVVIKFQHYAQARVPAYVIVDRTTEDGPVELRGYELAGQCYQPMPANEQGRLWLAAVGLWLGAKGERVAYYCKDAEEVGDYTAVSRALRALQARAGTTAR